MTQTRGYTAALLTAAGVALAACGGGSTESNQPVNKTLVVTAGSNVNQYNGSANPIVIRLYQLSSRTEFEAAEFWDIFDGTDEDLEGVVIDKKSLAPLYPGESRLVDIDVETDAFFLAGFAEFADYQAQQFSSVVPISNDILDEGVTVSITASGISIAYRNSEAILEDDTGESQGLFGGLFGSLFGGG